MGFGGMGGAEVARAQTIDIPRLVSVDLVCRQPTSGPRPRVSDHRSDRATRASTGPSPGAGCSSVITHTTKPAGNEVRNPGAHTPYLLQCCVFKISFVRTLEFGGKTGLSH